MPVPPNPSLNADVPHAGLRPGSGPPVSSLGVEVVPRLVRPWSMEMPLLGKAAMLLSFDVVEDAIPEHDDWHTHEHLPERLSIPGFLRGTRWASFDGKPRYFVMYEVVQLATL